MKHGPYCQCESCRKIQRMLRTNDPELISMIFQIVGEQVRENTEKKEPGKH